MINLRHIGLQVHTNDVNAFYIDILNGKLEGNHKIKEEQGARLFAIRKSVIIKYLKIGNTVFELFLYDQTNAPSFHHICLETAHPELIFKKAVERGFDGRSMRGGEKITYFIKDHSGNTFELKPKV